MPAKLCEMKKLLKADFESFTGLVVDPTHLCKRCGRVSNEKKRLCKPQKIKAIARTHS